MNKYNKLLLLTSLLATIVPIAMFGMDDEMVPIGTMIEDGELGTHDCSICFSAITEHGSAVVLPCSHQIHADCFKPLLGQYYACPVCAEQEKFLEDQFDSLSMPLAGNSFVGEETSLISDKSDQASTTVQQGRVRRMVSLIGSHPKTIKLCCGLSALVSFVVLSIIAIQNDDDQPDAPVGPGPT